MTVRVSTCRGLRRKSSSRPNWSASARAPGPRAWPRACAGRAEHREKRSTSLSGRRSPSGGGAPRANSSSSAKGLTTVVVGAGVQPCNAVVDLGRARGLASSTGTRVAREAPAAASSRARSRAASRTSRTIASALGDALVWRGRRGPGRSLRFDVVALEGGARDGATRAHGPLVVDDQDSHARHCADGDERQLRERAPTFIRSRDRPPFGRGTSFQGWTGAGIRVQREVRGEGLRANCGARPKRPHLRRARRPVFLRKSQNLREQILRREIPEGSLRSFVCSGRRLRRRDGTGSCRFLPREFVCSGRRLRRRDGTGSRRFLPREDP